MKMIAYQLAFDSQFVIPARLRTVCDHILNGHQFGFRNRRHKIPEHVHHIILHPGLHDVGRHLYIVSARFISFRCREIGHRAWRALVFYRYLRQYLPQVRRYRFVDYRSGIKAADIFRFGDSGWLLHRQVHFGFGVVMQFLLFIIDPDSRCQRKSFDEQVFIRRLMIQCRAVRRHVERAGHIDGFVRNNERGHLRVHRFQPVENRLQISLDAVFFKFDRCFRMQAGIKSIYSDRPLIVLAATALERKFLTDGMLLL